LVPGTDERRPRRRLGHRQKNEIKLGSGMCVPDYVGLEGVKGITYKSTAINTRVS